ncbi:beta-ketoacyl synthase N-terminal-like domain-containing protein [Amycolatopsis aidingensis]|uniref:beta-ketoacyl synthase N-terminal-like domain-containing protein n=1 Tax=Amycolatopsis aidingensis TaxID=2842453 RepID=UPI001C0C74B6|nr:beta-ketoacyl synthase N-terminal-like domain-containing protein [Amycolatopsis aidingensis]
MSGPLVISGWSAVSAAGIGALAFNEGILPGWTGRNSQANDDARGELARRVPGFDVKEALGRKNTRSMDRVTGLAVLTVARMVDGEREQGHGLDAGSTGLVLGTTTGSVQSMMDFTRDSFTQDRPHLVDPARFPNAVMNRAAGQAAIWHGLRGPNATIASGHVAGISALRYAARLHRAGHARTVLCGAVEELTPLRVWLERKRGGNDGSAILGEGCAVVRLESPADARDAGRPVLAYLLGTAFRVPANDAETPAAVADCATSVLARAGASTTDVWALAGDLTGAADARLREVFKALPRRITLASKLADTGAAAAALHVAAVLCHAAAEPAAHDRLALVASVDRDGATGIVAFRLPPG